MEKALLEKYNSLKQHIESYGSVAVAFSSGVDSTFLLYAAKEALGDRVIAVTASSNTFPKRELVEAKKFCEKINVRQYILETNELEIEGFAANPKDRCYICKKELFKGFLRVTREQGMAELIEGSNKDDEGDYRPGLRAIAELDIKSPLREIGFTKAEIRELSEHFNLPTWNKPSFACLASRFPYGEEITEGKLGMIEKSEQLLLDMGFTQFRVRIHGDIARIELLPEEFDKFMEDSTRLNVYDRFKEYGFSYVALDIKGYRTGSMNEVL